MDGLGGAAPLHGIAAAPRRERLVVAFSLTAVVALAWAYLFLHAAAMPAGEGGAGMPMTSMPMAPGALALAFLMWLIMMIGMMLPAATPAILLYGAVVRAHASRGSALPAVWVFVGGYLLAWAGFSAVASLLQAALEQAALLSPALVSASPWLSGLLILGAGLYQFTPLKDRCLGKCREPLPFFLMHWRPGADGALRLGMAHGAYCVGCCWMLMLLLFAAGVMNLAWVALIAAFVFAEKLLPGGRLASRLAGSGLVLTGLAVLLR